jgi:hypothetical protein
LKKIFIIRGVQVMIDRDLAQTLQKWIQENQTNYSFEIIGGIVVFEHPSWKMNSNTIYNYTHQSEWKILEFI